MNRPFIFAALLLLSSSALSARTALGSDNHPQPTNSRALFVLELEIAANEPPSNGNCESHYLRKIRDELVADEIMPLKECLDIARYVSLVNAPGAWTMFGFVGQRAMIGKDAADSSELGGAVGTCTLNHGDGSHQTNGSSLKGCAEGIHGDADSAEFIGTVILEGYSIRPTPS
jgi:hypothetical protein